MPKLYYISADLHLIEIDNLGLFFKTCNKERTTSAYTMDPDFIKTPSLWLNGRYCEKCFNFSLVIRLAAEKSGE
jgi:hypothetical protein